MDNQIEQLGERIAEQAAHLDAAMHHLLTDLREFDERGGWRTQGASSCAHWLSWRVGWDLVTARDHVRVARKLGDFSLIDDALRRGEVSYSKVRAILRAATPENEPLLLEHAKLMTASQLEKLAQKYQLVQRHGEEPHPLADVQRRYVRRRDTEDGMVKIEAVLHPEEAELVWTMLTHAAAQLTRTSSEAAPAATAIPAAPRLSNDSAEAPAIDRSTRRDSAESPDCPSQQTTGPAGRTAPRSSSAAADVIDAADVTAPAALANNATYDSSGSVDSPIRQITESADGAEPRSSSATPDAIDSAIATGPAILATGAMHDSAELPAIDRSSRRDSAESSDCPIRQANEVRRLSVPPWARWAGRSRSGLRSSSTQAEALVFAGSGDSAESNLEGALGPSCGLGPTETAHGAAVPRSLLDRLLDEADALRGAMSWEDGGGERGHCPGGEKRGHCPGREVRGGGGCRDDGEVRTDGEGGQAHDVGGVAVSAERPAKGRPGPLRERMDAARRGFNRADALVSLAQGYLRGNQPERAPIEVILTVAASSLHNEGTDPVQVGELGDTFVGGETVRRLTCDAGVIEVVEDEHGVPLSVGRKRRTIAGTLRRALRKRDGACAFPSCTNRIFLEGHHVKHWADGGETSLNNAVQLCSLHHRYVHEYGYIVEMGANQRPQFRDPHGRQVAACPERPMSAMLGWPTIRAMNEPLGIDASTIAGPWDGTPVDYGRIVGHLASADGLR